MKVWKVKKKGVHPWRYKKNKRGIKKTNVGKQKRPVLAGRFIINKVDCIIN